MEEQIRQILPEKVRQAFDDIVEQRVLGAKIGSASCRERV